MDLLKRIALLLLIIPSACYSMASFSGYVQKGGSGVVVNPGITSTGKVQTSYPGSTVTAYITGGAVGAVTTSGTSVTYAAGTLFNANSQWNGLSIVINSVIYTIGTVSSDTSLTLTSSAGVQATPAPYSVTTAPAAIYSDNSGTIKSNPFQSDSTGYFHFFASDSTLDLKFSGTGISTPFTWGAVQGIDPAAVSGIVNAASFGVRCDGASNDSSAINTAVSFLKSIGGGTLAFPRGTCLTSGISVGGSSGADNIVIQCSGAGGPGGTVFKHTGSGAAVYFGQPAASGGNYGQGMHDCTIQGNASTTIGLSLQSSFHGSFSNIRVLNVAPIEFQCVGCVLDTFVDMRISNNETGTTVPCTNGMIFDSDPNGSVAYSQANIITNPIVEGCSGKHIWLKGAVLNTFIGGTTESNGAGVGVQTESTASRNMFIGLDTEALSESYHLSGTSNAIVNPVDGSTMNITSGCGVCSVTGGFVSTLNDAGGATFKQNVFYVTLNETGTDLTDISNVLNGSGVQPSKFPASMAIAGLRPITLDGGSGNAVTKTGDGAGWSFGYAAKGSGGADLGGFGISGTANALGSYYIGTFAAQLAHLTTSSVGGGYVTISVTTVGLLPACVSGNEGTRMTVTDSNAASFTAGIGAIVVAGGTTHVPVVCVNGNWRIG